MSERSTGEPMPIWFFVGLILLCYGVIVVAADFLGDPPTTVLAELRPRLWWGSIMAVSGAVFTAIGVKVHRADRAAAEE